MGKTVLVEYRDIFSNLVTAVLVGSSPTITVTNPPITSPISYFVTATILTEGPLLSTIILSDPVLPFTPTKTITSTTGTTTFQVGKLTTIPGIQVPLPTITSAPSSSSTSTLSTSSSGTSQILVSPQTSSSTSSTFPSPATSAPSKHTSGPQFGSGAIAGAAVGCLIGGALIAGLLVWLFVSSRLKRRRPQGGFAEHPPNFRDVNQEKSLPAAPLLGGGAAGSWEQHLPQSESDSTMRTRVKALFDQIELHVENFYRNAAVPISPESQTDLTKVHSNYLPDSVVNLLSQTKTQMLLIKHCLAYLIASRITADSDAPASFLPVDFVALPRAMGGTRANQDKPVFAQALSRWRVLSSYLRPRAKDDRAYLSMRDANIAAAADLFCSAFAPWAINPKDLEARRQHLINIMKAAADTGILIFSQPSRFAFRWTVPSERDRRGLTRIVVLPGFVKMSDERAKDLSGQGQELVAPVVGTL